MSWSSKDTEYQGQQSKRWQGSASVSLFAIFYTAIVRVNDAVVPYTTLPLVTSFSTLRCTAPETAYLFHMFIPWRGLF